MSMGLCAPSTKLMASILLGISTFVIAAFAYTMYPSFTLGSQQNKEPPPLELATYGPETADFEDAKAASRIANARLPSQLPSGYELDAIRTYVQEGTDVQEEVSIVTVIYTQGGKQTGDADDFRQVLSDGAIIVLYIRQSSYLAPTFDWEKQVQTGVDELPDIRSKVMINGYTAVFVDSSPAKAKVMFDGTLVEVLTPKYDKAELENMLQGILS